MNTRARSAASVVAAAALVTTGASAGAAGENNGEGRMTVRVSGLPATATWQTPAKVTVIGPVAKPDSTRWKVKRTSTSLRDLAPGLYQVSAGVAYTSDREAYVPNKIERWVRVKKGATRQVSVKYTSAGLGVVIPPDWSEEIRIDMKDACRYLTGDKGASAWQRNAGDLSSWYCTYGDGSMYGGMDLDRYCRKYNQEDSSWKWYAMVLERVGEKPAWFCWQRHTG